MGIELVVENVSSFGRLISNYERFHELNSSVIRGINELNGNATAVLSGHMAHRRNMFSDTYDVVRSGIEEMINLADNPFLNPERPYRNGMYCWQRGKDFDKYLGTLDSNFRSAMQQVEFSAKMGYRLPNERVKLSLAEFSGILSGRSRTKFWVPETFEEFVREIHGHFYHNFNSIVMGGPRRHPGAGKYTPYKRVAYFATDGIKVDPRMLMVKNMLNSLNDFNVVFNEIKQDPYSTYGGSGSAITGDIVGGFFTDTNASFVTTPSFASDDNFYIDVFYNSIKGNYRVTWELGTKGRVGEERRKVLSKFFRREGWKHDKSRWDMKHADASKDFSEEDLDRALSTVVVLTDFASYKNHYNEVETGKQLIQRFDAFVEAYQQRDAS